MYLLLYKCHKIINTILFVENKNRRTTDQVDVSNTVSTQEAWEVAKLHDTSYIENSSVTGEQVSGIIHMAIRKVAYLQKLNSRCHCRFKLFKWNKCKKHKWYLNSWFSVSIFEFKVQIISSPDAWVHNLKHWLIDNYKKKFIVMATLYNFPSFISCDKGTGWQHSSNNDCSWW